MSYKEIVKHYEECFTKYGPNHRGVDWPNQKDLETRFKVMTDVIRHKDEPTTLLDFGCGPALLLKWLKTNPSGSVIKYIGCDLSQEFISFCQQNYPDEKFLCVDAIQHPQQLPVYDYAIMNGVLTMKVGLSHTNMWDYSKQLIKNVFGAAKKGVSVNFMSSYVDWERDDLFHLPIDEVAQFAVSNLTRHFVVRHDYGLYEYTVYLYKEPE